MLFSHDYFNHIDRAATSDLTLMLSGPTGTGKSTLARMIHDRSRRSQAPFVRVNLATLSAGTLESELFGHERGAFTGAERRHVGRIERAKQGTLFLDEVADLTLAAQSRLLEVLQERVLTRVGGSEEILVQARFIAATNANLRELVHQGRFREDLFYRLCVSELRVPALNNIGVEFNELVHYLIADIAKKLEVRILGIDEVAASLLESYPWPGNVRELKNTLEFAIERCAGGLIRQQDLPVDLSRHAESVHSTDTVYDQAMQEFERRWLLKQMQRHEGRLLDTARSIQIHKSTLIRRAHALGLLEKCRALRRKPLKNPGSAAA